MSCGGQRLKPGTSSMTLHLVLETGLLTELNYPGCPLSSGTHLSLPPLYQGCVCVPQDLAFHVGPRDVTQTLTLYGRRCND